MADDPVQPTDESPQPAASAAADANSLEPTGPSAVVPPADQAEAVESDLESPVGAVAAPQAAAALSPAEPPAAAASTASPPAFAEDSVSDAASAPPASSDELVGETASAPPAHVPTVVASRFNVASPEAAVPLRVPDLTPSEGAGLTTLELLDDVELDVKIELGRTQLYIEDVLRLGNGSVIKLDKLAGDPVDVYVNDRLVAYGEVLVLNENFCVRINDIISPTVEFEDTR